MDSIHTIIGGGVGGGTYDIIITSVCSVCSFYVLYIHNSTYISWKKR